MLNHYFKMYQMPIKTISDHDKENSASAEGSFSLSLYRQ